MIAWRDSIADREITKQELQYLVNPAEGVYALERLRTVIGLTNFQGTNAFVNQLKFEHNNLPSPSSPTGVVPTS